VTACRPPQSGRSEKNHEGRSRRSVAASTFSTQARLTTARRNPARGKSERKRESRNRRYKGDSETAITAQRYHDRWTTSSIAKEYLSICRNPLQDLRRWVDTDKQRRRVRHCLPARSRTRMGQHGIVRPLRGTRTERVKEFHHTAGISLSRAGMCEAQRIDYEAACRRIITWAQYFARWGAAVA
jgi:hypothetical protein